MRSWDSVSGHPTRTSWTATPVLPCIRVGKAAGYAAMRPCYRPPVGVPRRRGIRLSKWTGGRSLVLAGG
jgi:hypothetical protein